MFRKWAILKKKKPLYSPKTSENWDFFLLQGSILDKYVKHMEKRSSAQQEDKLLKLLMLPNNEKD